MRIIGYIDLIGPKVSLERVSGLVRYAPWKLSQIGLKKNPPLVDIWSYRSPYFELRDAALDEDVARLLRLHSELIGAPHIGDATMKYAFLTLVPVREDLEEEFATILEPGTLALMAERGLALQISPEAVMPVGIQLPVA